MVRTKKSAGSLGTIVVLVGQVDVNPQATVSSYKSHQVGSSKSFGEWQRGNASVHLFVPQIVIIC